jgi:RimJ/RimL family protein N-acetyltransferase
MYIIKTERLTLRPLELSDLYTVHDYESDITITEFIVEFPNDSIEKTEKSLQRVVLEWEKDVPQHYEFAIIYNEKHIGAVSITLDKDRQEGEMGWILNKKFHGNGFGTEAAKAIMNFALEILKLKKIFATCDFRNKSSVRIMEKIGLKFENENGVRQYKGSEEKIKELMYSFKI